MDAAGLRAAFEGATPLTIGLEEEVMLLDPETLELAHRAPALLERLDGDRRFKLEFPASQLELVTPPLASVPAAVRALGEARRELLEGAGEVARPAAAGAHPFGAEEGVLNEGERYSRNAEEYGRIGRRQLVCALQVHVAVGGADRTLAVYNALRDHLPELAALAANAPFYRGCDTGLASVRPKIAEGLPRQGVPPPLASWEQFAGELRWGAAAGGVPKPASWWWELRPHPAFGTLEVRVPDAQAALPEAAAVASVAHALVAWLAERHDGGEPTPATPTWRIEENRWSACRHGVEGAMADLQTGERRPTRERLRDLLDRIEPAAERLGAATGIETARALVERNGAIRQREVAAAGGGPRGVTAWLADRYAGQA
jgi:carboxylate-amine ligase